VIRNMYERVLGSVLECGENDGCNKVVCRGGSGGGEENLKARKDGLVGGI